MLELDPNVIAFSGDWHGNTMWAANMPYLLKEEGVTHIFHAGDFGFRFDFDFRDQLENALRDNDIMLYFVDGNHDYHDWIWAHEEDRNGFNRISEHVRYIPRGHRFKVWDKTFMGLGGATSVDKDWRTQSGLRAEWWSTEQIRTIDVNNAVEGGPVDVMICHDAPSGIPIPGITYENGIQFFPHHALMEADWHRDRVRYVVDMVKPKLFVHGHYHVNYEFTTYDDMRVIGLDMDGTSPAKNIHLAYNSLDLLGHLND